MVIVVIQKEVPPKKLLKNALYWFLRRKRGKSKQEKLVRSHYTYRGMNLLAFA